MEFLENVLDELLIVQSPPWSPSVTVAPSSFTATVHAPAPSMAKTYVLLMLVVFPVHGRGEP